MSNFNVRASNLYASKSPILIKLLVIGSLSCLIIPGMGCPAFDSPGIATGLSTGGYLWVFAMVVVAISAHLRNKEQAEQLA
ncbi:hypothetical protein [Methylotenera sp.]|uniref:hypothetical protein n=1 Tax=Methylotenera sp. TaxID=2051956 RepID=UPI002487C7ED|nr:hypothetical protein [Methylotenera sp.]MDI1298637.1 hypothetical protein [Methylotenera sp.]